MSFMGLIVFPQQVFIRCPTAAVKLLAHCQMAQGTYRSTPLLRACLRSTKIGGFLCPSICKQTVVTPSVQNPLLAH